MCVGPQFVYQHQMLWNLTKINHQELLLRLQLKELHIVVLFPFFFRTGAS